MSARTITNKKSFRFQNKRVLLTYSDHVNHEHLLQHLERDGYRYARVVHETGSTGHKHTHLFCEWTKRLDTINERFFDITVDSEEVRNVPGEQINVVPFRQHVCNILQSSEPGSRTLHPNIKIVSGRKHELNTWDYLAKDGIPTDRGNFVHDNPDLIEQTKRAKSIVEAARLWGIEPKSFSDLQIIRNDVAREEPRRNRYPNAQWTLDITVDRCLFIYGPTGTGKTQWALSRFTNPLLVRHIDDLRGLSEDHDGIVFDDMSFTHWPRTQAIHLLDWEEKSSIHCRFRPAVIPARTRKIFTSNLPFEEAFPFDSSGALKRRINIIKISGKLYRGEEGSGELEEDGIQCSLLEEEVRERARSQMHLGAMGPGGTGSEGSPLVLDRIEGTGSLDNCAGGGGIIPESNSRRFASSFNPPTIRSIPEVPNNIGTINKRKRDNTESYSGENGFETETFERPTLSIESEFDSQYFQIPPSQPKRLYFGELQCDDVRRSGLEGTERNGDSGVVYSEQESSSLEETYSQLDLFNSLSNEIQF